MDTIDYTLVAKGSKVPHAGILDQARYHARLAETHVAELATKGWTRAHAGMLLAAVALIDNERSRALDARDESKANHFREQAAITIAKTFKADLVMAFDDLYFEGLIDAKARERIRTTHGPLGRSAPAISKYMADVRSLVEKHEEQLRPYFEGESAHTLLVTFKDELDEAQVKQETDYKSLPRETLKVYEAKGRALFLIEKSI